MILASEFFPRRSLKDAKKSGTKLSNDRVILKMEQFYTGSVVWASARGDIFWPGQVGFLIESFICLCDVGTCSAKHRCICAMQGDN